jgi:hypothetical protein
MKVNQESLEELAELVSGNQLSEDEALEVRKKLQRQLYDANRRVKLFKQ